MKTVSYTPETLPSLTESQKKNLKRLAKLTDDQIDTSDLLELTDEQLAEMEQGRLYRPRKLGDDPR